jgi:hypothetical protein
MISDIDNANANDESIEDEDENFSFKVRHHVSKKAKSDMILSAQNNHERRLKYRNQLDKYIQTFIVNQDFDKKIVKFKKFNSECFIPGKMKMKNGFLIELENPQKEYSFFKLLVLMAIVN